MVIFDYLRARLFDLRKNRAIKQARRDAATYGKKIYCCRLGQTPGLCLHAGRENFDPSAPPRRGHSRKNTAAGYFCGVPTL